MAADPLKNFRNRLAEDNPVEPVRAASGLLLYQAFDAKDKIIRLDIHRARGLPSHALPYAYLLDVIFGRHNYAKLMLVYRFMVVQVQGRNLRELTLAVKSHRAEYLQEFDEREFEAPAAHAPLIERIDVVFKDMAQVMGESDAEFEEAPQL